MDDFHDAHLVLDGGGRKGARTPRVVYELMKQKVVPTIVACTSAGILTGLSLVAAQHTAKGDIERVPALFYENAMGLWGDFARLPLVEIDRRFAFSCWHMTDQMMSIARMAQPWMPYAQLFPEPHMMAPLVRRQLPNIDAALHGRHSSILYANRVDLHTGREEIIDSTDSQASLESLLDTTNIPFALPARGGKIDGAFSGYNGPLHALPDDGLPRLRVGLPKPKFTAYEEMFADHKVLRARAHAAELAPAYVPDSNTPYLHIKFDDDGSPIDALPTAKYIKDADAEALAKVNEVIASGALNTIFAGRPVHQSTPGKLAA